MQNTIRYKQDRISESRKETIQELFSSIVEAYGDRKALEFDGQVLTYRELKIRSEHFAQYLRSQGVCRGDFVVLFMPRGIEMFIGMLGILEAGAVYVPVDPQSPFDRLSYVYQDCKAKFIVSSTSLLKENDTLSCIFFDLITDAISAPIAVIPSKNDIVVEPDDLAYVIYTSGSTGRPKGVMIRHHSLCNFIRAESALLQVNERDIVLQGFSLSFDMSLEEIWTSFFAGAKLVIASQEMMHSGPDLAQELIRLGITVWHCVPTLLALQKDQIPSLRLINAGGEACPAHLVDRWVVGGRRMVNTYGPTETTVSATLAELSPGKAITIGRALPNYEIFVVDENLKEVQQGKEGELCIAGPGLAAGYLNQPELTKEKFTEAAFCRADGSKIFFYRTGDLALINEKYEIEFLGRIDSQIKIRGFRVELTEIESVIMESPAVQAASVALLKDQHGFDALIAFLQLNPAEQYQEASIWHVLRSKLPSYMIPNMIDVVLDFPRLPSGKVDRKKLKFPEKTYSIQKALKEPSTPMQAKIHQVWTSIFAPVPVSIEDDFFLDLGGHSLKAALMVSNLRKEQKISAVSIQDVYTNRTIESLAVCLEKKEADAKNQTTRKVEFNEVSKLSYVLCSIAQAFGVFLIFGIFAIQWLLPFVSYSISLNHGVSHNFSILIAVSLYAMVLPMTILMSIVAKWTVIGTYKEGDYPLWGLYYFRWWFVRRIQGLVPVSFLRGTPLMSIYLRLLGAKIGKDTHINNDRLDTFDLLTIGDGAYLSHESTVTCNSVENGILRLRAVKIGDRCHVGSGSIVGLGANMATGAQLGDLSLLSNYKTIPAWELWSGSPAVPKAKVQKTPNVHSNRMPFSLAALQSILVFLLPFFTIAPVMPGLIWLLKTYEQTDLETEILLFSPLLAFSYLFLSCLIIVTLKWLIVGKVKEGRIWLGSLAYVRYWFAEQLMQISLDFLRPIYATLFLSPWFRMLGVKVGKRSEVSFASAIPWDLLTISEECFVADGVTLGVPRVADGFVELKKTHLGKRTFLGNSAMVPGGTHLGDNMLIGCLSVPPLKKEQLTQSFSSWFGSPAIFLPQRQIVDRFSEKRTYQPTKRLYLLRLAIESIRVLLPYTCLIMLSSLLLYAIYQIHEERPVWYILAAMPFLYCGFAAAVIGMTVFIKRMVIGTYEPIVRPLWSHFVWRSELVTCLYENFAVSFVLEHLRGTPYINAVLRLLGCKIGKRVYNDTTDITEFDVIQIGDDVALNDYCGLQTHLFEERVMKVSKVTIGDRCTVGSQAIVLYDAVMESGSQLGDLSMLMKGETLPSQTEWEGLPAQHVRVEEPKQDLLVEELMHPGLAVEGV